MKDYKINLSKNRKTFYIQVSNPVTLQLAVSFTNSLIAHGEKMNLSHVIVDIRNTKSISSIFDKYIYAHKKAKSSGLSLKWRIALLKKVNDASPDFLETVMINAGYQFKIFTNEEFAFDWLESHNKL